MPSYSNYSNILNFDLLGSYCDSPYDDYHTLSPEYLYNDFPYNRADHSWNHKQAHSCFESCCSALCTQQSCQLLPNHNAFYPNCKQSCHNCQSVNKPTYFQGCHGDQCFTNPALNQNWQPFLNNGRTHKSYQSMDPALIPHPSPFRNPNIYKYTDDPKVNQSRIGRKIFGFQKNGNAMNLSKLPRYFNFNHIFKIPLKSFIWR